jgi:hypothetical protein
METGKEGGPVETICRTGDTPKAREAYEKLATLASADADRPELAEAKAFLAN